MTFPDRLLAIPSRTTRLLIGKTDFQQIHDIQMREIEAVLSELVEINAAMFHAQNEQYLGKLFPEPAPQKAGNGNGAQEEPDEFDAD